MRDSFRIWHELTFLKQTESPPSSDLQASQRFSSLLVKFDPTKPLPHHFPPEEGEKSLPSKSMKTKVYLALASCAAMQLGSAATISHRYSYNDGAELVDSVGGNTGTLQNGATVSGGALQMTGLGTNTGGNHMGFTNVVGIGSNFGASGVSIESWYTDSGTGTWGKLFHFGDPNSGLELGYTHARGNGEQSGLDRDGTKLFGEQVTQNVQHLMSITVSSDGNLNLWIDGDQKLTDVDTNDLSSVTSNFEGIGATSWNDPGMTGSVDELRIWSGELSASQVALNLAAGPDLVAVPEPSGMLLALAGTLLAFRRRRT